MSNTKPQPLPPNPLKPNFLEGSTCADIYCEYYGKTLLFDEYDRCPKCKGPLEFPTDTPFTINDKLENIDESDSILSRYYSQEFVNEIPEKYRNIFEELAKLVSFTPLIRNAKLNSSLGLLDVWFKLEGSNGVSQSFKDRGTLSAILFLLAKNGWEKELVLGTVSLGNMAISTAYVVDWLRANGLTLLSSFIVVNNKLADVRLEAIQKSAPHFGTDIFRVDGNYAEFHENVYQVSRDLRKSGKNVYAQLTDDVFRAMGYVTVFFEIIEQSIHEGRGVPDFIVIPSASGACFRAADYALQILIERGVIYPDQQPRLVLVQEEGADPIVQARAKKLMKSMPITIKGTPVADAIAVSNSRSGTPCLDILNNNRDLCVSVFSQEILHDHIKLAKEDIKYETGSVTAITAIRKLKNLGVIKKDANVVALLTGLDEPFRELMKNEVNSATKIIDTKLVHLQQVIEKNYE